MKQYQSMEQENALSKRGLELSIYAGAVFLICGGFLVASIITDGTLLKSMSSLLLAGSAALFGNAVRYFYYAGSRKYRLITGEVLDVQVKKTGKSQSSVIRLITDTGATYLFETRQAYVKGIRLNLYAVRVNEHFQRDGSIVIEHVLHEEREE